MGLDPVVPVVFPAVPVVDFKPPAADYLTAGLVPVKDGFSGAGFLIAVWDFY